MIVLGRARPRRSGHPENIAFHNSHMFEVAADRSSGCQAADSSADDNRMLTYGGERHQHCLSSFPEPYRRPKDKVLGSEARWGHKLVSDPLAKGHAFDRHRMGGPNYSIIFN